MNELQGTKKYGGDLRKDICQKPQWQLMNFMLKSTVWFIPQNEHATRH